MKQTYTYYQPEYVRNFKCNGQACSAHCCRRWRITIDKKTFKKYSHIKPKSAAKEITSHIIKSEVGGTDTYQILLDSKQSCPFLTGDNWCHIQKEYGEDFLSETCVTYPRRTWTFGTYFERSLTLTCPVVAAQVLIPNEPIKFETVEVSERVHNNLGRIQASFSLVPRNLFGKMKYIQETAVTILQERTLTIDSRLMLLGLYFDKLDELLKVENFNELEQVNAAFKDSNFLQEQANNFSQVIKFDVGEHIKIMFGTLETLYGEGNVKKVEDRKFVDAVADTLRIQVDENKQVSVKKLAENYLELDEARQRFSQYYSTLFENYLVNELFMNLYPFKFKGSITYNYGVFVTIYKLLELITFSMSIQHFLKEKKTMDKISLTAVVMMHANNIDHNKTYTDKISEYLKDKNDIVEIMQSMLQV